MSTHSKSSLSGGKGGHVPAFRKSRFAAWFVGLAAIALTVLSVSGYAYDRKQLELIAAAHLRLLATGPAVLETAPRRNTASPPRRSPANPSCADRTVAELLRRKAVRL